MAQQQINPGSAPVIWSDIASAFETVNNNFTELYASIGGDAVDFTNLGTSLVPRSTEVYDLGTSAKRWRDIWLSGSSIHLGDAVITSTGTTVNLPVGSTIGGLRVDENYFKFIAVDGQDNIEADDGTDTLTVAAGNSGITLTTDSSTDKLTITNSGVTSLTGTVGQIGVSQSTGGVTLTNLGVTSATAGQGISVNAGTGSVTITNSGVIGLDAGIGIQLSPRDSVTGVITITNSQPNIPQQVFSIISVPTQTPIAADSTADTLTIETSGDGLSITTAPLTDTLTFRNTGVTSLAVGSGLTIDAGTGAINLTLDATLNRNIVGDVVGDLVGSVFADDSSVMVDAIDNSVHANNVNVNNSIFTPRISSKVGDVLPMQITAGQSGSITGNISVSTYSNSGAGYGGSVGINTDSFTVNNWITVGVDVNLVGRVSFSNGVFSANSGAYFQGNLTGDVIGSIFADDSTKLVDAVEAKIVGDIDTASLRTSETQIRIGSQAGETGQEPIAIAIGQQAGQTAQGNGAVAIGANAGMTNQGDLCTAVGISSGLENQGTIAVSVGYQAGLQNQGEGSIAMGYEAGRISQGIRAVALGRNSGSNSQGDYAIAIGHLAGLSNQPANSIVINASGAQLDGSAAGLFVDPIRNLSGTGRMLQYDTATKEVSYTNGLVGDLTGSVFADDSTLLIDGTEGTINAAALTGALPAIDGSALTGVIAASVDWTDVANTPTTLSGYGITDAVADADLGSFTFTGSTLDTSDSSGISVTPAVTFNSDVTVENELYIGLSRVMPISELKAIVAASTDFADFQTRIAAL